MQDVFFCGWAVKQGTVVLSLKSFYMLFDEMICNGKRSVLLPQVVCSLGVMGFLLLVYSNSLWQLFRQQMAGDWSSVIRDPYVRHILVFSFSQALLSAVLSVGLGLVTAHALFYQSFFGKQGVLKWFSLTMVLPVLVAVFGLLGVYGSAGWLARISEVLGFHWKPNIYGLSGILLAHVFFNLPLSAKVFLNSLHSIPNQQRQLAAQLGILNIHFIRLVEWRYLRRHVLPTLTLVFMLCFTSFSIVLTLGGGPRYTTLEVAIYQAIVFDFELGRAAIFALLQFVFCFCLFQISNYVTRHTPTAASVGKPWRLPLSPGITIIHYGVLIVVVAFMILPLLSICISGLDVFAWSRSLANGQLYKALAYSLTIAPLAGGCSVAMASILLLGARKLDWLGQKHLSNFIIDAGMMILAVPALVLAVGLFLLLRQFSVTTPYLFMIVVLCNALMAMPFALRILTVPFFHNMTYYEKLCQSLGIRGFNRLWFIEWHNLKQPLKSAFALTTALSLGDFTVIALFGNQSFTSLPRLLYQQLGNYHSQEAAVTALILLVFCGVIFYLIEEVGPEPDRGNG